MTLKQLLFSQAIVFLLISLKNGFVHCENQNLAAILEITYKTILRMRSLPFEDCGSKYDVLYLSISSCDTIPCPMKINSNVVVHVIFDDNGSNTSFLKHQVNWIFNSIQTDATISPDPCDGIHQCINSTSDGKSISVEVTVNDSLPLLAGTMLWRAFDSKGKEVICLRVPVAIEQ